MYFDSGVVLELERRVTSSTYRAVATEIGVDYSFLCRVINGSEKLPESMAQAAGFELVQPPARRWKRRRRP
jgi:hypothetical protein